MEIFAIPDIREYILQYLSYTDRARLARVCKLFYNTNKLYHLKTKYLQKIGIEPVQIATIYNNMGYLKYLKRTRKTNYCINEILELCITAKAYSLAKDLIYWTQKYKNRNQLDTIDNKYVTRFISTHKLRKSVIKNIM